MVYKYMTEHIMEWKSTLLDEAKRFDREITLWMFYETVTGIRFTETIFLCVKYFDYERKEWIEYEPDESELEEYFWSQMSQPRNE